MGVSGLYFVGVAVAVSLLPCHGLWVWWLGGAGGCGSIDLLPLLIHQLRQSPQTLEEKTITNSNDKGT